MPSCLSRRRGAVLALLGLILLVLSAPVPRHALLAAPAPLSLAPLRHTRIAPAASLRTQHTLTVGEVDPRDLVPDRATVTFSPSVGAAAAARAIASHGDTVVSTIPELGVYEVQLSGTAALADAIRALAALPGAVRAEPAVRLRYAFHPNDPLYDRYQRSYLSLLHAEQAWDVQQGDPRVVVAVVDSGVDLSHPDLAGQIWTNPNPGQGGCGQDVHGCNFMDPAQVDPTCPAPNPAPVPNPDVSPYFWHGTFVSGVIGAATNNGQGVAGVVPHATIMPVKVGDCSGPYAPAVAKGVLYAAANGAQIINLSIGSPGCNPAPSYLLDAIAGVERRGVLVVAAAGDDGTPCVASPANAPGVLAVGAVAADGNSRAPVSQWGPEIAVVAPGELIVSTVPKRDAPPPNDEYQVADGTSFAAPLVAGLADLLLSQNPLLTPDLVRALIQHGATPLAGGEPGWAGAGRIDLAASLALVPAGFYGRVSGAGAAVPDGTPVTARIGGALCGQTTTTTVLGQATYVLFVPPQAAQADCGAPGAQVDLSVGGAPAGTGSWSPAAIPLDLSAAPGGTAAGAPATGAVRYHGGWNLVGGPAGTVLSAASGPLYTLQAGDSAYETVATGTGLTAGAGYWAYFPADATVVLPATDAPSASALVPAGAFVMVGNPSGTRSVTVSGADAVYVYDPGQQAYQATMVLAPGQGAWVYSAAGGTVTLK